MPEIVDDIGFSLEIFDLVEIELNKSQWMDCVDVRLKNAAPAIGRPDTRTGLSFSISASRAWLRGNAGYLVTRRTTRL
ncbi:hypothetical protein [Burkholderia ubonensis]|uniref:hypothetical protein n=1 Tax=Burkholderia ubonensis TaxID=101571 RepID=UPI0012FC18C8|nr:hypothetical protein [Burkholderia ubonensis]